jgi:hypothetical protein
MASCTLPSAAAPSPKNTTVTPLIVLILLGKGSPSGQGRPGAHHRGGHQGIDLRHGQMQGTGLAG